MYGAAGWTHVAGIPRSGPRYKPPKGKLAKGNKAEAKGPKFDKANQSNARRLGVRNG